MVDECDFCAIAAHERDAYVVYEDEETMAFFPLAPATAGHTLLIPKRHVPDIWKLDSELGALLMRVLIRLSNAIREAVHPDGLNIINSAGSAAAQTVAHLHFHLVPRWLDDDFGELWPPKHFTPEVIKDDLASAIASALKSV